jgi:HSP90 family molecular chaperone
MKKQFFMFTALLILSMLSFRAFSQAKADSAAINARVEKALQKLNADVQLTTRQTKELKPLFLQRDQVRLQMKTTYPKGEAFSKLQSDYQELNRKVQMILTDEQRNKLEEKKKARIEAATKGGK